MKAIKPIVTDKEIEERYLTKTLDGFYIEKNIYTKVSRYLRKTFISLYEVFEVIQILERYNNVINELSLTIRNYIQYHSLDFDSVFKAHLILENTESIDIYNKYRCTLKPLEHIEIIISLIPLYYIPERIKLDNKRCNITSDFKKEYLKDMNEKYEVIKWINKKH